MAVTTHVNDPMAQPVTDLGSEYKDHLADLQARFNSALERCGHGAVLICSGLLLAAFRDDQSYPFRAQAWFSIWSPLTPAPDCFVYV
jgi:Xaa-Pro dipeptidase